VLLDQLPTTDLVQGDKGYDSNAVRQKIEAKGAAPRLVCEVEFSTWTRDGRVRHPSFKGMRQDKATKEIGRERQKD
jgi:bifunctional non-homologous end joining protein LigD